MIILNLSADVLGQTRFSISPLTELTSSLRFLGNMSASPVFRPWVDRIRGKLDRVDMSLLLSAVPDGRYIPTCLMPPGRLRDPRIEDQLQDLAVMSAESLSGMLTEIWEDRPVPDRVVQLLATGDRAPTLLAEVLWDYWTVALAPHWSRIHAVLSDDVDYRTAGMQDQGLFAVLTDLHPEIHMSGTGLCIDKPHFPDSEHEAHRMTLTSSMFTWPHLVIGDLPNAEFALTYGAFGVGRVWEDREPLAQEPAQSLASLLGRTRAAILRHTAEPASTTHLARLLGQSPATVSEHLTVLRNTGLVTRRRSGRSVLYRQTAFAEHLIRSQARAG